MNTSTIKDLSTLRSSLASRYLQEQVTTTQRTPWYSPSITDIERHTTRRRSGYDVCSKAQRMG
eukprot:177852-Amphidinium_carterae.1